MAPQNKNRPFLGSERPPVPGAALIGPVDPAERIRFTILLRQRPDGPPPMDFEHWQNTPPGKRKFLSLDEFFRSYGATEEDMAAVVDFLTSEHLHVVESHAGRRRIEVEGSAADINGAFGITLNQYRAPFRLVRRKLHKSGERPTEIQSPVPEHIHRGFAGPVHLPARLLDVVAAVIGLDNRRLGGPAGTGTGDPAGAQYLSPTTVANRYNFPTFSAAGQTIGLFEAADDGAAYLHSDITDFMLSIGAVQPNLADIGLLGYTNNTALVPGLGGGVVEATLDVAVVGAIARGVNINVYFTENTELGWEAFLDRATFPQPGDNPPSVISASWIFQPDDSINGVPLYGIPGIGNPFLSGTVSNTLSGKLQLAAMRGITVLMAVGDWGASNQLTDKHCHVSYPNSDPWVTSCGGTILGAIEELTWSDANTGTAFDQGIYDATGGGVSDTFPIPAYQAAAGILPISKNDGNVRRGLPDVAGMVAMSGFFINGIPGWDLIGTSAVSPLYAGLIGVINAFLGHNVGFLNPTLYKYGPDICHDIVFGNNDYGPPIPPLPPGTPDSPFYTSDIGWDPCTGWGSINGLRLLAALAPAPIVETAIAGGDFANTCVGKFSDEILTINNTGFSMLLISHIAISPGTDFAAPSVTLYPLAVSPGASMDVVIRFRPSSPGFKSATLTVLSNDLSGPHTITIAGTGAAPRLVLMIADKGSFGNVCVGSFRDEPLILNNSGNCTLMVTGISSSSSEFLAPGVSTYPLAIGPGDSMPAPIRFQPTSFGATPPATITVASDDPAGPKIIAVSGNAPSGTIAVTGSTRFGGVKACCSEERTLSFCNVGDCKLQVSSIRFKRKSRHWKLINNPFPATLHPGSCLSVVIRYRATERCPRACELVITSNDPATPVKTLDLLAYTIWDDCGCKECCGDCQKGGCEKRHQECCCRERPEECCDDEDDDEN